MKTNTHFWPYLALFFSEWQVFQSEFVEKIKTRISNSVTDFENRAVYEIMWKNCIEPDRLQKTVRRVRISWWIPKATNIHSELCNNYWGFHCNNGCRNALHCSTIRTLSVLFRIVCVFRQLTEAEMSKKEVPNTSCQSGPCDVVYQKSNLQIQ